MENQNLNQNQFVVLTVCRRCGVKLTTQNLANGYTNICRPCRHALSNCGLKNRWGSYRYHANRRGIEFKLTKEQFIYFWKKPCTYCNAEIKEVGIDRVDNSKGYEIDNSVSCCPSCNYSKQASDLSKWLSNDNVTRPIKVTLADIHNVLKQQAALFETFVNLNKEKTKKYDN